MFKFAVCFTEKRPEPLSDEPRSLGGQTGFELQVHQESDGYWTKWLQVTGLGVVYEDEDATPEPDVDHLVERLIVYLRHMSQSAWWDSEPAELAFVLSEQRPQLPNPSRNHVESVPGTEYVVVPNGSKWDLVTTHVAGDKYGWRTWIGGRYLSLEQAVADLVINQMMVDSQATTNQTKEVREDNLELAEH